VHVCDCLRVCVQGSCSCSGQFDSPLQQSLDWETAAKQFEGNWLFLARASFSCCV